MLTPSRSRLLASMAMLAFVVALVGALTFHPRKDSIEAATESPVTEPVRATAIETSSTAAAPTSVALRPSTTPPTTRKPSPPTTVKPFIPSSTVPKLPSTTTTTKPKPTTTTAAPTTTVPAKAVAAAPAPVAPKPTPPAPVPAPAPTTPPATSPPGNSSDAAFLACVKKRESGGNYQAVGAGYYGAYQFSQGTWDGTARHAGRMDLVGKRPDRVSPADQDAMAWHLLGWQGRAPWGGSCH